MTRFEEAGDSVGSKKGGFLKDDEDGDAIGEDGEVSEEKVTGLGNDGDGFGGGQLEFQRVMEMDREGEENEGLVLMEVSGAMQMDDDNAA